MSYDKKNIKNTTEDGIADLVRDIISVPFSLDYVFTQIKFKPYHVKIKKALLERDEEDWSIAHLEDSIDSYKEYLSHYSRETPYYTGIHIVEAEEAIRKLKEAEQPIEPEVPIEPEEPIIPVEPKATNTQIAEIIHLISVSAHRKELDKEDNTDWLKATSENAVSSYLRYIQKHLDNPYGHVGKHVEEAKRQHLITEDNSAWETAREVNTRQGYETYLSKYKKSNGLHVRDAQNAILKLQEEKDWNIAITEHTLDSYERYLSKYNSISKYVGRYIAQAQYALLRLQKEREEEDDWRIACAEDTLTSYKNFVAKYKAMKTSIHLSQAEGKIKELTPPTPNKWIKWLTQALLFIIFCTFFYQLKHHHVWPFNERQQQIIVEPVDSLQWAIDNHNIPVLKEYADRDSTRAFYPLSLELWDQSKDTLNSLIYIRKAISSIQTSSPLYQDYNNQLEVIKNALDYYNTIGHIAPALSANIEERLLVLPTEYAIIKRASEIAEKYSFEYTPNKGILKYINDDFRRWVEAGDNSPIRATKEDCYKAALQLKEDESVRRKLNELVNELKI